MRVVGRPARRGSGSDRDVLSFAELLTAAQHNPPDVVVTDYWQDDNHEVSDTGREQLAKLGRLAPVILLTGRDWGPFSTGDDLGVACVLPKPLDIDELLTQVRHIIGRPSPP